jgi:hypothetical protein
MGRSVFGGHGSASASCTRIGWGNQAEGSGGRGAVEDAVGSERGVLASMCGSGPGGTFSLEVDDGIGSDASRTRPSPIVSREQPQALNTATIDATARVRHERPRGCGELIGYSTVETRGKRHSHATPTAAGQATLALVFLQLIR